MQVVRFIKIILSVLLVVTAVNSIGLVVLARWSAGEAAERSRLYPTNDLKMRESLNGEQLRSTSQSKVIMLGNSVVWGAELPDLKKHFVSKLQDQFNESGVEKLKFVNAGVHGSDLWREFNLVRTYFSDSNVKLVVWFVSGNDFIKKSDTDDKKKETTDLKFGTEKYLSFSFLSQSFYKKIAHFILGQYQDYVSGIDELSKSNLYYTAGMQTRIPPNIFSEITSEIKNFNEELKSKHIKFIAIYLPPTAFVRNFSWVDATSYQQLDQFLKRNQIPSYQLIDKMKALNCGELCFLDYVHLNEKGHAVLAELLPDIIKQNLTSN